MIKLICDLNISLKGHNAGYAQFIVDNIQLKEEDQIYFLFNKCAKNIINITSSLIKEENFFYSESDFQDKTFLEKFKFAEWKVINNFARILKIDELFIMDLTRYEVQIGRSKVLYKISGIEFRPSHRIKAPNDKLPVVLRAKIQKYKRRFFESLLLKSKSLENIFILNDKEGVVSLNKLYNTTIFKYLVDPVFDYRELDNESKTNLPIVNQNKVVFIIFGSLDWRKNIANIFNAFTIVNEEIHKNIILLIAGKIPSSFENEFRILVRQFTINNPTIELVIIDNFISNSQMEYLFSKSDISLVIYSKFYGSSALLGRAAKYNLISLVPNVGLMAEMCRDYKLGYLCDPNLPDNIKSNIVAAYNDIQDNKMIDGSEFYKSHSPQRFLQLLNF